MMHPGRTAVPIPERQLILHAGEIERWHVGSASRRRSTARACRPPGWGNCCAAAGLRIRPEVHCDDGGAHGFGRLRWSTLTHRRSSPVLQPQSSGIESMGRAERRIHAHVVGEVDGLPAPSATLSPPRSCQISVSESIWNTSGSVAGRFMMLRGCRDGSVCTHR